VTWPDTGPIPPRLDSPEVSVESIENQVRQLVPQTEVQRSLQLAGLVRISSAPLRDALSQLGR
jgi:hypothetical protein